MLELSRLFYIIQWAELRFQKMLRFLRLKEVLFQVSLQEEKLLEESITKIVWQETLWLIALSMDGQQVALQPNTRKPTEHGYKLYVLRVYYIFLCFFGSSSEFELTYPSFATVSAFALRSKELCIR